MTLSISKKDASESIIEKLVEHGADVNRLSYISYEWPVEGNVFKSFETALITSTRHGRRFERVFFLKI